jgi:hypothetical protein
MIDESYEQRISDVSSNKIVEGDRAWSFTSLGSQYIIKTCR